MKPKLPSIRPDCDTQLQHIIQALLYKDDLFFVIVQLHLTLPLCSNQLKVNNGKTSNTIKDLPDVHKSSLDL